MANELDNALVQIQTYMRLAALGLRGAPDRPPEQVNVFPFVITRAGSGTWQIGADGTKLGLHNLIIELHVARNDLPRDLATVNPYCDSIPNLLIDKLLHDNKWNHTISTFQNIAYRYMVSDWAVNLKTIGIEFTVNNVKIQTQVV